MSVLDRIINLFKKNADEPKQALNAEELFKEEKDTYVTPNICHECPLNEICNKDIWKTKPYLCKFIDDIYKFDNIDKTKKGILLIDDNDGVISFLEDDLNDLNDEGKLNLDEYNILKFSSQYAAFILEGTLEMYPELNIQYAIFDLTLGGGVYDEQNGNIILDGVDAFINVKTKYPDVKYKFFTGNKLNPYINKNQLIMGKFSDYTGEDIKDHILYKTQLSQEERKAYLLEFLK